MTRIEVEALTAPVATASRAHRCFELGEQIVAHKAASSRMGCPDTGAALFFGKLFFISPAVMRVISPLRGGNDPILTCTLTLHQ